MKTEIQPERILQKKENFTEDSELNENWNSTRQRQY